MRVFFSFDKYRFRRSGLAKYWRSRQNQYFFHHLNFVRATKKNLIETRFRGERKNAHPDLLQVLVNQISVRSAQPFRRNRGKTSFLLLKARFWNKRKIIYKLLFSFTLFSCCKLWKNSHKQQKLEQFSCQSEKTFPAYRLQNFCFFRNYPTRYNSDFYSVDRVHHHTH